MAAWVLGPVVVEVEGEPLDLRSLQQAEDLQLVAHEDFLVAWQLGDD